MRKILSIFLLFAYSLGCSMDSNDDEGIGSLFPTPAILEENGSPGQDVNRDANNLPITVEVVVEEAIVEPAVAAEVVDNIAPQIVSSTVKHGDINVDVDRDRFIFTFSEDIAGTNFIKLIDNTTGLPTGWVPFIRGKEIEISKGDHGFQLIGGHVYTITIRVADVADNWTLPLTITFVTEFINFAAEEQAIRDLYAEYTVAHGDQDVNALANMWLRSEERDVFTVWTFWAGTFEKNEGWQAVTKAWEGIFRLRDGKMIVDITYIAIDSKGKTAVLHGTYNWGNTRGRLISELKKDGKNWKIRAIDYTDERFGKQIKTLIAPAHIFGEIAKISFKDDIQLILAERCAIPGCHAAAGAARGLNLTQYDTFKKGGANGPAFAAGDGKGSLVVKRIDGGGMPPIPPPLNAEQVQLFIDWIDEGAKNN